MRMDGFANKFYSCPMFGKLGVRIVGNKQRSLS